MLKGNWLARPGDRSGDICNALLLPGEEQRHERERERVERGIHTAGETEITVEKMGMVGWEERRQWRERKTPVLNAVRADIFNSLNIVQRKTGIFFTCIVY